MLFKIISYVHKKAYIVSFLNSMTFAFSEVLGRSYGGGVLTFEPSESEKFPVPYTPDVELDFDYVDNLTCSVTSEKSIYYQHQNNFSILSWRDLSAFVQFLGDIDEYRAILELEINYTNEYLNEISFIDSSTININKDYIY